MTLRKCILKIFQTEKQNTTDGMVETMFTAVFDENEPDERKVQVFSEICERVACFTFVSKSLNQF